jgi:hypothetical protein
MRGANGRQRLTPPSTLIEDALMQHHIYKTIELTGTSTTGIEDAIGNAIARASKTIHNIRWFEVTQVRGDIESGAVSYWQVTLKLGFTLDEAAPAGD